MACKIDGDLLSRTNTIRIECDKDEEAIDIASRISNEIEGWWGEIYQPNTKYVMVHPTPNTTWDVVRKLGVDYGVEVER